MNKEEAQIVAEKVLRVYKDAGMSLQEIMEAAAGLFVGVAFSLRLTKNQFENLLNVLRRDYET